MSKQDVETDFNAEFLTRMIPRLEWPTVLEGAKAVSCLFFFKQKNVGEKVNLLIYNFFDLQIGAMDTLPSEPPQSPSDDTDFLQKLHHVLLEVDITEGHLECPETGRKFPISNGIPNMLLNEDEV